MIYKMIKILNEYGVSVQDAPIIRFLKDCFVDEMSVEDEIEFILDDYDVDIDKKAFSDELGYDTVINNFKKFLSKEFNLKDDNTYNSCNYNLKDRVFVNVFKPYGFECVYVILKVQLIEGKNDSFMSTILKYDDINEYANSVINTIVI